VYDIDIPKTQLEKSSLEAEREIFKKNYIEEHAMIHMSNTSTAESVKEKVLSCISD
jgi:hypothetical protein